MHLEVWGSTESNMSASEMPEPANNLSDQERPWVLVFVLFALLVMVWFSPWWAGGRYFAPLDILNQMLPPWCEGITVPNVHNHFVSDAVTQYLPYHILADRCLKEDGFIGWNPYSETGTRLNANTMALPGDWSLQLYRWFDFWTAWHLGLIGQLLIAGWGMLVFLRARGCLPWASLAGAVAFAANGQFVVWFFHRWALASFCWIPWLLWALFAVFPPAEKPDRNLCLRTGWILLAAVFLAFAFLGGTLQHAVYIILVVGCFWAAEVVFSKGSLRRKFLNTGLIFCIGFVGVVLAAGTLLPCIDAFLTSRAAGDARGGIGYPGGFLQPVMNLIAYGFNLYPSILGSPQTMDGWKIFKSCLFDVGYLGTIPVALAFCALFRKSAPPVARWMIAVALVIPLTPLVGPLYHRVLLLFVMGGSWVLADFLSHGSPSARALFARRGLILTGFLAILWLIFSCFLFVFAPTLKERLVSFVAPRLGESQFGVFRQWFFDRTRDYVDTLFIWSPSQWPLVLLIVAGFLVLYLAARHSGKASLFHGAFCVLLTVELSILAARWITTVDPKENPPYKEIPVVAAIRRQIGDGRLFQKTAGRPIASIPMAPNIPSVFRIRHLATYESIHPSGLWADSHFSEDADVLASLGVSHVLQLTNEPVPAGWVPVFEEGKTRLLRLDRAAIPLFTAGTPTGQTISLTPSRSTMNHSIFSVGDGGSLHHPLESSGRALTADLQHPEIKMVAYDPGILQKYPQLGVSLAFLLALILITIGNAGKTHPSTATMGEPHF
jgi:hypothetical protein